MSTKGGLVSSSSNGEGPQLGIKAPTTMPGKRRVASALSFVQQSLIHGLSTTLISAADCRGGSTHSIEVVFVNVAIAIHFPVGVY